jgi:DNA-binding NarL/FixJ family response regulator
MECPAAIVETLPLQVFLVEDSPIIRARLTESFCELEQVDVIGFAETEQGACEALATTYCDVVVLDLQLKEGNGLAVLKSLRARDARPVVIVFTNYNFPHYRAKSLELGADHFFDKAREYDQVREVLTSLARSRS